MAGAAITAAPGTGVRPGPAPAAITRTPTATGSATTTVPAGGTRTPTATGCVTTTAPATGAAAGDTAGNFLTCGMMGMRGEQEVNRAMERYADTVRRLCLIHLKNHADTEDIFQTVF